MQTVSDQFLRTIRNPHTKISVARHRNLVTGVWTTLPIVDGTVTVDVAASTRRTLDLTVPPQEALWDALDTVGGEITVTQYIRYVNGTRETVPLGVFVVDQDQIGYGPSGNIAIKAPDRWMKVQRNRFGLNRASVPANATWQEIQRLVEACWSGAYPFPGWATLDTTATAKVGPLLWDDGDRDAAIETMATDSSVEVFFDAHGQAVLRPIPTLSNASPSVWTVDASGTGVLVDADRSRDRSSVHNAIVLTTSASDVAFAPVIVQNTTSGDPLAVSGPLGAVVLDYSSATLRSSGQAAAAGKTLLSQQLGLAKQLSLEAVGNPALDAEDIITVRLPRTDLNLPRPVELHIIDSVTHPLTPTGTQSIKTRSTRPDTDGTS